MTNHTILWSRGGADWDDEQTITFGENFDVVSIHPGAGNHGVFTDVADRMLMDEAQDWLENEGYDEAKSLLTGPPDAL